MAEPLRRRATYEDLCAVPDGLVAEIVGGDLHAMPRPGVPHSHAATVLGMDLGGAFQRGRGGPGGWWFIVEPELHLGEDILVPDLAAWRRERMSEPPQAAFVTLTPDWICEVLSERTRGHDRVRKLPAYRGHGVGHAWLVDPASRTLEVFRREHGHWAVAATFEGSAEVRAEPFEAMSLKLGDLWLGALPGA